MEPFPFLERRFSNLVVFFRVPLEHGGVVFNAHAAAECLDHGLRVVEEIVRVDDADFDVLALVTVGPVGNVGRRAIAGGGGGGGGGGSIMMVSVLDNACSLWANKTYLAQVVKHPAQLVVSRLRWVKLVEPRHSIQGGDGAPVIRGNAVMRVPDEKGEVEPSQQRGRDNGGIARLSRGVTRCLFLLGKLFAIRANSALWQSVLNQRRCDAGGRTVRRDQVVDDIFDEDAFSLEIVLQLDCFDLKGEQEDNETPRRTLSRCGRIWSDM